MVAGARLTLWAAERSIPWGRKSAEIPGELPTGGIASGPGCVKLTVIANRQGRGTGRSDHCPWFISGIFSSAVHCHMGPSSKGGAAVFRRCMMVSGSLCLSNSLLPVLVSVVSLAFSLSSAQAAITATGDVLPSNLSGWRGTTTVYIGKTATGSLIINGGAISSSTAFIAYNSGIAGSATISGTNSTWTNSSYLYVGNSGSGTMNGGGQANNCEVSYEKGVSTGKR